MNQKTIAVQVLIIFIKKGWIYLLGPGDILEIGWLITEDKIRVTISRR